MCRGDPVRAPRRARRPRPGAARRRAWSTCTSRDPDRTSARRWPPISGTGPCSWGPTPAQAVNDGRADYVPVFLSEVPHLFERGALPLDVVLVNATPPDAHGFCSLGTSVEAMHAAIRAAKTVIVQLNRAMPRTLGESFIHVDDIDLAVEVDVPPYEYSNGRARRRRATDRRVRRRADPRRRDAPARDRRDPRRRRLWPCWTIATSGSTPRCSPTRSSTWSRPAW